MCWADDRKLTITLTECRCVDLLNLLLTLFKSVAEGLSSQCYYDTYRVGDQH